jgi:hypothetical protein
MGRLRDRLMADDTVSNIPRPGHAVSRDPHDKGRASGRLDFGWWASNAPTGGYLTRLSLDEAGRVTGADASTARCVDLHVLRLAAADDFETSVEVAAGPSGLALVTVTFRQARPFAVASVYFSPSDGPASAYVADAAPPAALPPRAYAEMTMGGTARPPVTSQFRYRPTTALDGTGPRPGWDVFWVQPARRYAVGRAGVVGMIDCWYPPSYMRSVRENLRDPRDALTESGPTNLMGVQVLFSALTPRTTTRASLSSPTACPPAPTATTSNTARSGLNRASCSSPRSCYGATNRETEPGALPEPRDDPSRTRHTAASLLGLTTSPSTDPSVQGVTSVARPKTGRTSMPFSAIVWLLDDPGKPIGLTYLRRSQSCRSVGDYLVNGVSGGI